MASQEVLDKNYIIWNGFNTLENDILIEQLQIPPKAEEQKELIAITGRNGYLTVDYDSYSGITYEVQLNLREREQVDVVKKNFKGSGELTLSCNPDVYYKATITNMIEFERVMYQRRICVITFELQPLAYVKNVGEQNIVLTTTINNIYNSKSYPYLRIYGNGYGNVYINNETISFSQINEYIEVDCELEECYKGIENCNKYMTGDFITLQEGSNTISFDGKITKVVINPRWRTL